MSKLRRLKEMSATERLLLARVAVMLPIVDASLRTFGFRRTYNWLGRLATQKAGDSAPSPLHADHSSSALNRARSNFPGYRPTCLPQSLVLWHLLRSQGAPAELNIGVSKSNGDFSAHAWVELDGRAVNDSPDVAQRFQPVDLTSALFSAQE